MAPKKQVVVIGGGGAGSDLARALSQQLDSTTHELTLISAHPYLVYYVASLRMLVSDKGSLEKQILIPYDKLFVNGNGTFRQGLVTGIQAEKGSKSGGKVILQDGEEVKYDVLILAPGSKWESFLDFPYDGEKVQEHIQEWRTKFGQTKKVAIVGGGAVGIELAGEIRDFYPDTEVTVVHGDKMLLNKVYPDKYRLDLERRLRSRGVKLILDDYVDVTPESTPTSTRKGVDLDADLVVTTRGSRPNTSWIISSLGKDVANERGFLHIKPTLQLTGYPNIFSLGDVIDYPEQKQIGKYPGHVSVVAANVRTLLQGAEPQKQYKGTPELIVVTIGSKSGAAFFDVLWGLTFGNWIVSFLKGKGLFIGMRRKAMGYSA